MAETEEVNISPTDVYQQQEKTINTLIDVLQTPQASQVVYAQPAPEPGKASAPNYIMWIAIGVVGFFVLKTI